MKNYARQIFDAVKAANPKNPIDFAAQAIKPLAIEKLNLAIKNCHDCKISQLSQCCKTISRGNADASILVLCDFPVESQQNSGNGVLSVYEDAEEWTMIQKIISAYHINQSSLFFLNVVNCFPQKQIGKNFLKRPPNSSEMQNCKVFVDYAFKIVDPVLVILLGNFALNAVKEDVNIIKSRGEWITVKGVKTMPTYSPTQLLQMQKLKNPEIVEEFKADFCDDIFKAFMWLQNEFPDNDALLEKLTEE